MRISDDIFYTATMAKVYTAQGDFSRAAKIYRHLLVKDPHREEWLAALNAAEKRLRETGRHRISGLLNLWLDLMLRHRRLQLLQGLGRGMTGIVNGGRPEGVAAQGLNPAETGNKSVLSGPPRKGK